MPKVYEILSQPNRYIEKPGIEARRAGRHKISPRSPSAVKFTLGAALKAAYPNFDDHDKAHRKLMDHGFFSQSMSYPFQDVIGVCLHLDI